MEIISDKVVVMKKLTWIPILTVLTMGHGSYAHDTQIADTCFPIKNASDRLKTVSLKPDRRDTIDSFLEAYFVDAETRSSPMKLYLEYNETRDDFVISETGEVEDFHTITLGAPDEAIICGPMREDGKIGLGMSTSVRFKSSSGVHTMTEISDGVKDGKSHHKKNLSSAKALFVPKMTHIAIIYDDVDAVPNVFAIANGKSISVTPEPYGEMWVIDVDVLKDSNAETITIGGGTYELFPVPSIKKMKSLGIN